jgi:hypothetical protein
MANHSSASHRLGTNVRIYSSDWSLSLSATVGLVHRKMHFDPTVVVVTSSHRRKEASIWTLSNAY